jgi:hypothetical protein
MEWRKSSFSNGSGSCVETASGSGAVAVRDTTNRGGGTIAFSTDAWQGFLTGLK